MASESGQRSVRNDANPSPAENGDTDMATICKELQLNAEANAVWSALADFQNVHTRLAPGFVTNSKPDGDNARIITFANGSVVKETLVTMDEKHRRLAYVVTSERIAHHNASAEIVPYGPDRCRFIWTTDVLPDTIAPYIEAQMSEGAKAIKMALERG
jgi:hypothetical protein